MRRYCCLSLLGLCLLSACGGASSADSANARVEDETDQTAETATAEESDGASSDSPAVTEPVASDEGTSPEVATTDETTAETPEPVALPPVGEPVPPATESPTTPAPEPSPPEPVNPPITETPVCGDSSVSETAAACEGMCGNGAIDSCEVCSPGVPGTPTPPVLLPAGAAAVAFLPPQEPVCSLVSEQCDGAQLGEQSCTGLGFTAGELSCNSNCGFSESECQSCGTDSHIAACTDTVAEGQTASNVALATNNDTVAVAWTGSNGVSLNVYDADLNLLGSSGCLRGTASRLALASLPSGWVLGADSDVFVLGTDGSVQSQRSNAGTMALFATSRPGSTPLFVYSAPAVTAALLDESAEPIWETAISSDAIEPWLGSAVAVTSGFLVGLRLSDATTGGVHVHHLDQESGEVTAVNAAGSSATEYPQLASDGVTARLVWADFGNIGGLLWAALDSSGARSSEPVTLGLIPDQFNRSPAVMVGSDTVVLLGGYTGGTEIGRVHQVRRVDENGLSVGNDYPLQQDPNNVTSPQLAVLGDSLIAAWVAFGSPGRVGLAKLTP
jgi:hypothetical protein